MKILKKIFLLFTIIILPSCLNDIEDADYPSSIISAQILTYLESENNLLLDPFRSHSIHIDSLYKHLLDYKIIDIRSENDFLNGHIHGAINVQPKNLISYLNNNKAELKKEQVLISQNGQEAAYYYALLTFAGFNDVKYLEYGMSIWHEDFATEWAQINSNFSRIGTFRTKIISHGNLNELPSVENYSGEIKSFIMNRITNLINNGYASISKSIDYFYADYDGIGFINSQIICYGPLVLYRSFELGHPPGAIRFEPFLDIRSTKSLQRIPHDKMIGIYDWNGHHSTFVVAYLRLLGYNALNLHFGAYAMIYEDFLISNYKKQFILTKDKIRNFEYVK